MSDNIVKERLWRKSAILQEKLKLIQDFGGLTEMQQLALAHNNLEQFSELIEQRQKIIDQVNNLDSELLFLNNDINADTIHAMFWGEADRDLANKVISLEQEIQGCLQQASHLDQKLKAELEQYFEDIKQSMSSLRLARQTENAYHNMSRRVQGCFLDRKK